MHVPSLIEKKRDGGELSSEEIAQVISGFTRGEIPDYQMSALAMAIFFRGMSDMETWHLTKAMLESGQIFEYPPNTPAQGRQTFDRRNWRKDFTRSGTAAGL